VLMSSGKGDARHSDGVINRRLLSKEAKHGREGCLSLPGIYEKLFARKAHSGRALGPDGKPFNGCGGMLGVCINTRWTTSKASYCRTSTS